MFWRVASGSVASSVEAIISGGNFTLEQLLAEGDLVQVGDVIGLAMGKNGFGREDVGLLECWDYRCCQDSSTQIWRLKDLLQRMRDAEACLPDEN